MNLPRRLLPFVALLTLPGPAVAVDGVVELNQACAIQTGCLPGDTAGFPITISAPGSYRLTSNLEQDLALLVFAETAISITADDVSVDLNGFAVTCQAHFLPDNVGRCTNGTAYGIRSTRQQVGVSNGVVRGFPTGGVSLGSNCRVEGLTVRDSGGPGIFGGACVIRGNVVLQSSGNGIDAAGSTIIDNVTRDNSGDGIEANDGSVVRGNSSHNNDGAGIAANLGSLIEGNACYLNDGFGLDLATTAGTSGYRGNVLLNNLGGFVNGGVNLGGNLCSSIVCP